MGLLWSPHVCHVFDVWSQALTMVLEIFHPISEVDESFICVQRLLEVVDGTFVYHRVTLVSACVSCNEC